MGLRAWSLGQLAALLLLSLPAFGRPGECVAIDANDGGVVAGAEVCTVSDRERPEEGSATVPDWRDIEEEVQRRQWRRLQPAARSRPVTRSRPVHETTFMTNLDTMVSLTRGSPGTTSLLDLRLAVSVRRDGRREWLGGGLVVPFGVGVQPASTSYGDMADTYPRHAYADLGNLSASAFWEPVLGRNTRLSVSLGVALPTAVGTTEGRYDRILLAASGRGFEETELLLPSSTAIVPKLGLSQTFGSVELTTSVKFPIVLFAPHSTSAPLYMGVGTAQVMVRLAERPGARLAGGVRTVGALWLPLASFWLPLASVAVEPRVEARIGALELHVGFLLVAAYRAGGYDEVVHVADVWGLRSSVGYRF